MATRLQPEVVDAQSVGLVSGRIEALVDRARRDVDEGLLPACQVAVARDGKLACFEAFGDCTPDTRFVIFSSTKPIIASAVWLLMAEGKLRPDDHVAEHIPEFGTNGKDVITVEQVMLHTAGFPLAPYAQDEWNDRQARVRRLSEWRLNWEPGTAYEYHATSAHWVLVELIDRLSGIDFREFVATRIAGPLGVPELRVGWPADASGTVAKIRHVGEAMSPDELEQFIGVREMDAGEVTEDLLEGFNDPDVLRAGCPGGGGVMRAADLALFYQALLHNPASLWDEDLLRDATGRVRNNLPDRVFKTPASRGLGVVIAGDDGLGHMRGFGRTTSPRAFGHGGAGGQIGWADPDTGISVGYVTNGMDRHQLRQGRRGVALSSLAALCAEPV